MRTFYGARRAGLPIFAAPDEQSVQARPPASIADRPFADLLTTDERAASAPGTYPYLLGKLVLNSPTTSGAPTRDLYPDAEGFPLVARVGGRR